MKAFDSFYSDNQDAAQARTEQAISGMNPDEHSYFIVNMSPAAHGQTYVGVFGSEKGEDISSMRSHSQARVGKVPR